MLSEKKYLYSICTLVTQWNEYSDMKKSFEENGFSEACEYLVADNSAGNIYDAYTAIRNFLNDANGKYIVIVHQDVKCLDTIQHLNDCLKKLSAIDNKWAICGNSGAKGYHQDIMYINTLGRIDISTNLPCKVHSLDENLLIIDADKRLSISADIGGFHFYGTDLCNIADFLGYTSYVIPFMVKHFSSGNLKDMELHRQSFIDKYAKKLEGRYIQTTCTKFYLSNSLLKNRIYNLPFFFFFIKTWQRLKYNKKLIAKGNEHKKSVSYEK